MDSQSSGTGNAAEPSKRRSLEWSTSIQYVPGVGELRQEQFRRLGVPNAGKLLFLFPRDYEYPPVETPITALREGQSASVVGQITESGVSGRPSGKSITGILVENETGAIRLVFFNQPFRAELLRPGMRVAVSGTPRLSGFRMEFVHPQVTILAEDEPLPESRILPIYPLVEGLKQVHVRKAVRHALEDLADSIDEAFDAKLRSKFASLLAGCLPEGGDALLSIADALREIHQPTSQQRLNQARLRLIFQELLILQLALAIRRRKLTANLTAPTLEPSPLINARIFQRFPFEPTPDQRMAMEDVGRDMSRQYPMNRLIQGDVGSGKTVVALYAILLAAAHRHQAVMMAPTEILARQHHRTLTTALAESKVRVSLLSGSLTTKERRDVLQQVASGEVDVLVGTHSLLYGDIQFAKLGLCVIDEQHKFGVEQRLSLRRGGTTPHGLVLSATPIPRTVTMTLFGDLDVSVLRQKPPGRAEVHTYLAEEGWRDRWWKFVEQRLDEGRQAYVVTPRIHSAEDEEEDVSSATSLFAELQEGRLSRFRIGLLHGRMSNEEKADAMQRFAQGRTQILVSTTVIEVGIDVPNATVMTIMGAERFGLAQLHQLRGRVSRGTYPGHVCLFTDASGSSADMERLRILAATHDGFEIAEADFRLRGPGDLLGKRQSGMPSMIIADLARDEAILVVARAAAQDLVDADPELEDAGLAKLRSQVHRRYGDVLELGDVA